MDKPLIRISDLNLASALLTLGFSIIGTDDHDPKRVCFFFDDTQETKEAIDMYWKDELKVNPKSLAYSRREIISRIHQQNEQGN